jgi:uncharacterized membrane protein YtjA (UPF0391 family)
LWRTQRAFSQNSAKTLSSPPVPGTSCSAKSYIGGFNTAAAASLEDQAVTLLKWALIFFVISIIAGILGFTGISAASADVARILFYIFVVIFLVLLILGLTIFRV